MPWCYDRACNEEKIVGKEAEGTKGRLVWTRDRQAGKVGWILLWLIGVPIPVLLVLFLLRGCT